MGRYQPCITAAGGGHLDGLRRWRFGGLLPPPFNHRLRKGNTVPVLKTSAELFKAKQEQSWHLSSCLTFSLTSRAPGAVTVRCRVPPHHCQTRTRAARHPAPLGFPQPLVRPYPPLEDSAALHKAAELNSTPATVSAAQTAWQPAGCCRLPRLCDRRAVLALVHEGIPHHSHRGQYLCLKGDAFKNKRRQSGKL